MNWGIRFSDISQLDKFLKELTSELADRLKKARVKGRMIVLKVRLSIQPRIG